MKSLQYIIIFCLATFIACDSSSEEYSEEELETLKKAQAVHNEAMAIFSQTRQLLSEFTEARTELVQRTGVEIQDTSEIESAIVADTVEQEAADQQDRNDLYSPAKALHELNQAQKAVLDWMRDIYQVPHFSAIYEGEKWEPEPGIGKNQESNMLLTDMEFKEYPEGTSPEAILKDQKQMKQDILKAQIEMKRAIEQARKTYIYGEETESGIESDEELIEEYEEPGQPSENEEQ